MMQTEKFGLSTNDKLRREECEVCTHTKNTAKTFQGKLIEGPDEITIHESICGPFGQVYTVSYKYNKKINEIHTCFEIHIS